MLAKFPRTKHIEITTDTSKKEFKSVAVFKRVTDISVRLKKSFMVCTFGPQHGKFLYDGSGRVWEDHYAKNCVGKLGIGADDLKQVAVFMNDDFSTPATKSSDISQRITIVIPSVSHTLSEYKSIPRTTCNFCFYIRPSQPDGVHVRRYWCPGCQECDRFAFLKCTEKSCGKWVFNKYKSKKKEKLVLAGARDGEKIMIKENKSKIKVLRLRNRKRGNIKKTKSVESNKRRKI